MTALLSHCFAGAILVLLLVAHTRSKHETLTEWWDNLLDGILVETAGALFTLLLINGAWLYFKEIQDKKVQRIAFAGLRYPLQDLLGML